MRARSGAVTPRPSVRAPRRVAMPRLLDETLAGGLHLVAVRRPSVPMVEVRLCVPLGAGLVRHAAGPLVLTGAVTAGTTHHDRASLADAFERLGGALDAALDDDVVSLHAFGLATKLPTLLDLVNDVLTGATYPADEVRAERDRTADEVVMDLSRPEVQAGEAFRARLYGDHPYATPTPRPDALRRVGAASLRTIHPRIFNPRGAHLIVVGDVGTARVERLVSERLGPWLAGASRAAAPLAPLPPITPGGIELHDRPGAPQSNVLVGGAAPRRTDPQWPATALATLVVGGMFTSRLVENLRERHGYTYSPHSDVYHGRPGSTVIVTAEVGSAVTAASLVELRYELGRAAALGVNEEELEGARRYAIGSYLIRTSTQRGLAATLAAYATSDAPASLVFDYPARVARTTLDEVNAAARHHLGPGSMATVVVGDADLVGPSLRALDEVATPSS